MPIRLHFALPSRSGFGLIEFSVTLIMIGLLTLVVLPRVRQTAARHRLDRATALVVSDLENALAIAERERKPLRLTCTCERGHYQVTDRSGGALRIARSLTADGNSAVEGLAFSNSMVDIFPSRKVSSADTVTISAGGYTRRIIMTSSGEVQILPGSGGRMRGWVR